MNLALHKTFLLTLRMILGQAKALAERVKTFLIKGVIEILSSIIELGGLKCSEDKVGNSTALMAYDPQRFADYIANRCGAIVLSAARHAKAR